ncbi:unnamed protein product, partial [Ectocarpus sp. 12 AP-2014]
MVTPQKRKGTGHRGGGTPGTALDVSPGVISVPSSGGGSYDNDKDEEEIDDSSDAFEDDFFTSKRRKGGLGGGKGKGHKKPRETLKRMSDEHRARFKDALIKWRDERAEQFSLRYFYIFPETELLEVIHKVPITSEELCDIGSWRGNQKLATHGESLLSLIKGYIDDNNITLQGQFPWGDQEIK